MGSRTINTSRLARPRFSNNSYLLANNQINGNWGLIRHSNNLNPFSSLSFDGNNSAFTYTFDDTNGQGENVDMIFLSQGMIYTDNDAYKTGGVSRIQQFDWRSLTGSPTSVNVDYSTSAARASHSENVIACACHNDYGAATKANIYIIPNTQIPTSTHKWILARLFHQQKGNSNPTIVVNSSGSQVTTTQTLFFKFRGETYRTINGGYPFQQQESTGERYSGFYTGEALRIKQSSSELAEVKAATDAGVIHFVSAGNTGGKLEVPGGVDYGNQYRRYTETNTTYDVGIASYDNDDSIVVGNLHQWFNDGNTVVSDVLYHKDVCPLQGEFAHPTSNRGPRVDCYYAGSGFYMTRPNTSDHTATVSRMIFGTSYATPALAGHAALVLSKYPTTTPAQMRKYLREIAVSDSVMGDRKVQPKKSNGDFGDPDYFRNFNSMNSNLKITYIDPSLPYDPSTITDTTITYPTETLRGVYNY